MIMNSGLFAEVATQDRNLLGSTIHKFAGCNSRDELFKVMQITLVPLLKLDGVFITRFNEQSGETSISGAPTLLKSTSANLITLINQLVINNDPTRYSTPPGMVIFNDETQEPKKAIKNNTTWLHNFKSIAGVYDMPSATVGLWFYRKDAKASAFKQREIIILKYMQPIIIQAIKAITFQEERKTYSNIAEHFLSSNTPKAVIKSDCSVLISNKIFSDQISQSENTALPIRLHKHISHLINEQSLLPKKSTFVANPVFFRFKRRLYEISISPVAKSDLSQHRTWLLSLQRTSDTDLQLSRSLQDANITRRETEIILWMQKGLSCSDVATKLDLSYHPARTHVRNIYKKLGISSSRELLAFVHQPS
jgi:DNA-binding CsgD family transcriptional regulator